MCDYPNSMCFKSTLSLNTSNNFILVNWLECASIYIYIYDGKLFDKDISTGSLLQLRTAECIFLSWSQDKRCKLTCFHINASVIVRVHDVPPKSDDSTFIE